MRYVIYGAGAIGGAIGACLEQAGIETALIARGAHLRAIQTDGLRIDSPGGSSLHRMPAVGHPSELTFGPDDVVLLTMKTQDTEAALLDLQAAARGVDLPVVCVQNGVENERLALRRFERVYAMLVILPATYMEPGVVQASMTPICGALDAGRYPTGVDPLIERVTSDLERAGYRARADPQAMRLKYAKLLGNLSNTLQAAVGNAPAREIAVRLVGEAVACYQAAGIDWAGNEEMAALRAGMTSAGPRGGSSTWQSLARGTGSIETDFLNGEIALLGRLHGVPTPANAAMQRIGRRLVAESRQPGSFTVEEVMQEIALSHAAAAIPD